jgi:hypothetical protein
MARERSRPAPRVHLLLAGVRGARPTPTADIRAAGVAARALRAVVDGTREGLVLICQGTVLRSSKCELMGVSGANSKRADGLKFDLLGRGVSPCRRFLDSATITVTMV